MGAGCSGGSINQLTAASIYPGLLDGIQPSCTYPDSETTGVEVGDCEGLIRVYASAAWTSLMTTEAQTVIQNNAKQAAINGHLDQNGCRSWFNSFIGVARPGNYLQERVAADGTISTTTVTNNCRLPAAMIYDPVTNPNGARCTGQDHAVSIWGKVPGTNRAPSTRDNVGIVYGLEAFKAGTITAEELVVLNENVGGADFDVVRTAARSVADPAALDIAYRTGIVMDGHQLARTPIIDVRGFDEQGIHYIWRSFSLRARLDLANGGHANHVLWRFGTALTPPASSGMTLASFLAMDKWLTSLRADTGDGTLAQRIVADKPVDALRLLLPVQRHLVRDQGDGSGAVRRRRQAGATPLAAAGRRWADHRGHPQVPAEAVRSGGLRRALGRSADPPAGRVPRWRLRLVQARGRPAAGGVAAGLQCGARRCADSGRADLGQQLVRTARHARLHEAASGSALRRRPRPRRRRGSGALRRGEARPRRWCTARDRRRTSGSSRRS